MPSTPRAISRPTVRPIVSPIAPIAACAAVFFTRDPRRFFSASVGGFMMFLIDPTRREGLKRLLSTFGGYGLYWLLLERVGITRVNTLMFLVPPVTAVWGAAMFGEPFTWATATGLAIALVAVTIALLGITAFDAYGSSPQWVRFAQQQRMRVGPSASVA